MKAHSIAGQIPKIVIEKAPILSANDEKVLGSYRAEIEKKDNLYDGKVLHLLPDFQPEGPLRVFEGTYAWTMARLDDKFAEHTAGQLSVAILIRGEGAFLWQKRSSSVLLGGGLWDFSASGAAEGPDLEACARREALEEIGQNDVLDLKSRILIQGRKGSLVVFSGKWSGEEIVFNNEVEETFWGEEPPAQETPFARTFLEFFSA